MSVCVSCLYERETGNLIDKSMSKVEWADKIGVTEASIRRHLKGRENGTHRVSVVSEEKDEPKVRILALDIETAPNLAYVWGLWDQNVGLNQLVESTEMLCFGARWLGTDEVIFRSVHHHGKEAMLAELWRLLDEADALMGWNSKGFDSKHIKREFLEAGMPPCSPFAELDLMQKVKANFRFPSNKLDYVSQRLGVGAKVKHSGFDLWLKCMAGDEEAWKQMKTYQIQDVDLLIDLYDKLLPWISGHPNAALILDHNSGCVSCASYNVKENGVHYTPTGSYPRYVCGDCGKNMRGVKRIATSDLRSI